MKHWILKSSVEFSQPLQFKTIHSGTPLMQDLPVVVGIWNPFLLLVTAYVCVSLYQIVEVIWDNKI